MAIAPGTTLIDHLAPTQRSRAVNIGRDIALIVAASGLMALSARVSIPLSFTPVPITLQTLVVVLVGAALGSRRGALAMLLYLAEGTQLPVFAYGGGIAYLLSAPTAGYLWSYPFTAFVVGWLCQRGLDRKFLTAVLAMLVGTLIIYAFGVSWLALNTHLSLYKALLAGMIPFIPGDLIKILIAAALLPTAWLFVREDRSTGRLKR